MLRFISKAILFFGLFYSPVSDCKDYLPLGLQGRFVLGVDRMQAPWIETSAEQFYDLGIDLTKSVEIEDIETYVRVHYFYENWYLLEEDNQSHTYRVEWSVTF